jgi:hypothetical protein
MFKRTDALLLLILVGIVVGLLSALAPVSDFDHDGNLDSLVTEGVLLLPKLCAVIGLSSLLTRLPAACFAVSQPFSTLLVPPPISN